MLSKDTCNLVSCLSKPVVFFLATDSPLAAANSAGKGGGDGEPVPITRVWEVSDFLAEHLLGTVQPKMLVGILL